MQDNPEQTVKDRWGEPLKYDVHGVRILQIYQRNWTWLDTLINVLLLPVLFFRGAMTGARALEDPAYDFTVWRPRGPLSERVLEAERAREVRAPLLDSLNTGNAS